MEGEIELYNISFLILKVENTLRHCAESRPGPPFTWHRQNIMLGQCHTQVL